MEYNISTLNRIPLNTDCKIEKLNCDGVIKRRLLDLGFVKDTSVTPVLLSPSKGVKAFWIRNTLIAIRDEDSSLILVNF